MVENILSAAEKISQAMQAAMVWMARPQYQEDLVE